MGDVPAPGVGRAVPRLRQISRARRRARESLISSCRSSATAAACRARAAALGLSPPDLRGVLRRAGTGVRTRVGSCSADSTAPSRPTLRRADPACAGAHRPRLRGGHREAVRDRPARHHRRGTAVGAAAQPVGGTARARLSLRALADDIPAAPHLVDRLLNQALDELLLKNRSRTVCPLPRDVVIA